MFSDDLSPSASTSAEFIGVDVGGTKIAAAVLRDGDLVDHALQPTDADDAEALIAEIVASVEAVRTEGTAAVGVGVPSVVDWESGLARSSVNVPLTDVPLREVLGERLGLPVFVDNDATLAGLAEAHDGDTLVTRNLVMFTVGTGVGGGLVLDGKPWNGRESAGEIGHMVVVRDGRRCPCGRRGCMEAYAGRAAMEARARHLHDDKGRKTVLFDIMRERGRDRLTSGIWFRAADRGDGLAVELLEEAVGAIAAATASAVNLLDPEAVVIGGGLGIRFGEPWVQKIREAMQPNLFRDDDPPAIELAALGDLGGALGAALLVA